MTASPDVPAPDRPTRDLPATASTGRPSRAGRDLGSAIAVGLALGALILVPLLTVRQTFVGVLAAATAVATWELRDAVRRGAGIEVPLPVLLVGGQAMIWLSWPFGLSGLALSFVATALGCLVWRMRAGAAHYLRDVSVGLFTAVYVPLFCSFVVMLTVAPDGVGRVLTFMLCVVASDVGGYAVGVFAGKHPMAPSISPKKSWEGLGGSVVACMAVATPIIAFTFHRPWWGGLIIGAAIAATATLGDLAESMIKRDLGIKDMGHLLPGLGGIMDRLDSLLPSAAVAFLLLSALAPA